MMKIRRSILLQVLLLTAVTTVVNAGEYYPFYREYAKKPLYACNIEDSPFVCSGEGEYCRAWTDGCNSCSCTSDQQGNAVCGKKQCDCYETGSCVPFCHANENCVYRVTWREQRKEQRKLMGMIAASLLVVCAVIVGMVRNRRKQKQQANEERLLVAQP